MLPSGAENLINNIRRPSPQDIIAAIALAKIGLGPEYADPRVTYPKEDSLSLVETCESLGGVVVKEY
jgi:hypothetical protein